MLTPQEVSNHAFAKAVMGGYNMAMVDEFLDELTDDYTSLYKENAALKEKVSELEEQAAQQERPGGFAIGQTVFTVEVKAQQPNGEDYQQVDALRGHLRPAGPYQHQQQDTAPTQAHSAQRAAEDRSNGDPEPTHSRRIPPHSISPPKTSLSQPVEIFGIRRLPR